MIKTAAYDVVSYLRSSGIKELRYLGGKRKRSCFKYRFEEYRQALEEHGLQFSPDIVLEKGLTASNGYQSM